MDELRKNYVILLCGGVGSRMQGSIDCPKQYKEVNGKPIFMYSLATFDTCKEIDGIIIVAEEKWQDYVINKIKIHQIKKVIGYAKPGETRQQSIFSGLTKLKFFAKKEDIVIIHDAARPNIKEELIKNCLKNNLECDGVLPCIPVKDTIYESQEGRSVSRLLNRSTLYAGQAPESFVFGKYYSAHLEYSEEEIAVFSGSTEIAIKNNMDIHIIEGEESNYKITTIDDYYRFISDQQGD